jgi:hypothetical protein
MNEIFTLPSPVDNDKPGYVWREKKSARSSTTKNVASKKKGKKIFFLVRNSRH